MTDFFSEPAAWGIGAITGALISAGIGSWTARQLFRRQQEKEVIQVLVSIHAEVADRAARCLNDYLTPWKELRGGRTKKHATPTWVAKFRPTQPIVYPAIAAKIGSLPTDAISPILQFYFRLDALTREIDKILADFKDGRELQNTNPERLALVSIRFQKCLPAAATALQHLKPDNWAAVEEAAVSTYENLRETQKSLREALTAEVRK